MVDLLYRWDSDVNLYTSTDVSLINLANFLQIAIDNDNLLIKPYIKSIQGVELFLNPQRNMTAMEYLSGSKGVGGQILGLLQYTSGQENRDRIPHYAHVFNSIVAFKNSDHPHLLIMDINCFNILKGRNIPFYNIENYDLETVITPCSGLVKVAKLGGLMPEPSTNDAEINFIGKDLTIPCFRIEFSGDEEYFLENLNVLSPSIIQLFEGMSDKEDTFNSLFVGTLDAKECPAVAAAGAAAGAGAGAAPSYALTFKGNTLYSAPVAMNENEENEELEANNSKLPFMRRGGNRKSKRRVHKKKRKSRNRKTRRRV